MNLEKVVFGFFVLLAATLNFGYVTGDIGNPEHHNVLELYAAVVVNVIAAILKFGDRTQLGAVHLRLHHQRTAEGLDRAQSHQAVECLMQWCLRHRLAGCS